MSTPILLAVDIDASAADIYLALTTSEGQRGFWTSDADVTAKTARFGFAMAPMDLDVAVASKADRKVSMTVTTGFPFWGGSTWSWELGPAARAETGTSVLFRHDGFEAGYPDTDLAMTAHTWAMILDRLRSYMTTGKAEPYLG